MTGDFLFPVFDCEDFIYFLYSFCLKIAMKTCLHFTTFLSAQPFKTYIFMAVQFFNYNSHSAPKIFLYPYHIHSFVQRLLILPLYCPVFFNNDDAYYAFILQIKSLLTRGLSILLSPLHLSYLMLSSTPVFISLQQLHSSVYEV